MLEELITLKNLGVRYVGFIDDSFALNRERVFEICRRMEKHKLGIHWTMQTPLGTLSEDLIKASKSAGCEKIQIGVESGVDRIRNVIHKPLNNERLMEMAEACQKHGISLWACYMFGHPTETLADMEATIRFACRLKTDFAVFFNCTIFPGTELYTLARKEGKITPDYWRRYMLREVDLPTYVPEGVTKKKITTMCYKAYLQYYLRPRVVMNRLKSLHNFSNIKHFIQMIRIFFKTIFTLSRGL